MEVKAKTAIVLAAIEILTTHVMFSHSTSFNKANIAWNFWIKRDVLIFSETNI